MFFRYESVSERSHVLLLSLLFVCVVLFVFVVCPVLVAIAILPLVSVDREL